MYWEKSYQANFCGLGHIPLKNIEIPPQLQNLIDSSADRIEFIKSFWAFETFSTFWPAFHH